MLNRGAIFLCLALAACGNSNSSNDSQTVPIQDLLIPSEWQIGPIINGTDYSKNVPVHPVATPDGFAIDFPQTDGVHYVTRAYGSLAYSSRISITGYVTADPGVQLLGANCPPSPTGIALYIQNKNDDWVKDGYRWWATFAPLTPLVPGPFHIEAPLNGAWTSTNANADTAANDPADFAAAKRNTGRIGFTFMNCTGYGHGAYATGKARIVITNLTVE